MIKEEEGRRTRKEAGVEKRGRDVLVNACVRCTLFPSPMSEPRLGYFRDISFERERGERRREDTERMRVLRETMRACVRARVCLVESVIDLFREEAGISGLREGSVEKRGRRGEERRERERERERNRKSRVGGEKGGKREEKKETARRWTDGWANGSLPHLRAHSPIWIARWSTHE